MIDIDNDNDYDDVDDNDDVVDDAVDDDVDDVVDDVVDDDVDDNVRDDDDADVDNEDDDEEWQVWGGVESCVTSRHWLSEYLLYKVSADFNIKEYDQPGLVISIKLTRWHNSSKVKCSLPRK